MNGKGIKRAINDDFNNKNLFAENYFFVGTILIIIINILIYAVGINFNILIKIDSSWHWESVLYFKGIVLSFLNSFAHFTLQHALLNMVCFSFCGLYFERKIGSIKFVLLILVLAFLTSTATSANSMSYNWKGFSGVLYALSFYIIIDFLFSLKKIKRKRFNIIISAIVLTSIYINFCFSGGTTSFSFKIYPYNLITNLAHYSSALVGLIIGLFVQIVHIKTSKE